MADIEASLRTDQRRLGEAVDAVIGRHDGIRIKYTRVDDPQPQLALGIARSRTLEIGPDGAEITLKNGGLAVTYRL